MVLRNYLKIFKNCIIDINNLDESSYLEPDLIIRTIEEHRISNYLLYQSAYSELYFIEKYCQKLQKKTL
jgi:Undecaprenyl pyrophosphate synthase